MVNPPLENLKSYFHFRESTVLDRNLLVGPAFDIQLALSSGDRVYDYLVFFSVQSVDRASESDPQSGSIILGLNIISSVWLDCFSTKYYTIYSSASV